MPNQCMAQSSHTETSCYEVTVNIVMPPLATASNSDSQLESSEDSEIVSYSDSDSYNTGSTYVRRYTRNSGLGSASSGSTYVQGYTRKDGTNVRGHNRSGSSSARAGGFGSFRAGGASS